MRRALAQNPNLLRTLISMLLILILLLGYAVWSATVSTDYYVYTMSNEGENVEAQEVETSDPVIREWIFITNGSLTWINISASGLPADAILSLTLAEGEFYSHPDLGNPEATGFNCREPNEMFELVTTCQAQETHTVSSTDAGTLTLKGLVSVELPLSGKGTTHKETENDARQHANELLEQANEQRTWTVRVQSDSENLTAVNISAEVVVQNLTSIELFALDPGREMAWSMAAVIGCFAVALTPAFGVYLTTVARERMITKDLILQEKEADADPTEEA